MDGASRVCVFDTISVMLPLYRILHGSVPLYSLSLFGSPLSPSPNAYYLSVFLKSKTHSSNVYVSKFVLLSNEVPEGYQMKKNTNCMCVLSVGTIWIWYKKQIKNKFVVLKCVSLEVVNAIIEIILDGL